MNVYLLYPQREWKNEGRYRDDRTIIQDLGLKTLFSAAAKKIEMEDGKIKQIQEADPFLEDAMKKVMMIPLRTEEEIRYRQEIIRDCQEEEGFICGLYELSEQILKEWNKLGRKVSGRTGAGSVRSLVTDVHVLQLFVDSLKQLKEWFSRYQGKLHSRGFLALEERLREEFSDEKQENLERILRDVAFFANEREHEEYENRRMVNKPRIVMGCRIGDGLKPGGFQLESVSTQVKKYRASGSTLGRARDYFSTLTTPSFSIRKDEALAEQADQLEYQFVRYIISCCEPFFDSLNLFFDQLHFQAAFYQGTVNLGAYMSRFHIQACFPEVCGNKSLHFTGLKEFVMAIGQRLNPVGNTCGIDNKNLLIITGANQGGKSTFLRSIGIAQIMMQCGLSVAAESYESGIFPSFFTHFTRREDSEMNSGRLNEELKRMSQIIDQLEGDSLILLNESFASTTEKEGSVIAYDIIKALTEAGVKILTVTHLLSFAQRVYEETRLDPDSQVEFLSAQRMEDGRRTYRMIPHAPELTSFGLDLYDEIIPR